MEALRARDLRALLELAREVGELQSLAGLRVGILPSMRRLIHCDIAAYNEIDLRTGGEVFAASDPPEALATGDVESAFRAHAHQSPLIRHYAARPESRALTLSDFINRRGLTRLDLYADVYKRVGIDRQLAFVLPAAPQQVVGFSLSRGGRDFSLRERQLAETARPFIVAAYRNLATRASAHAALAELESPSLRSRLAILLDHRGNVIDATPRAERWLRAQFGNRSRLPADLINLGRQARSSIDGAAEREFVGRGGPATVRYLDRPEEGAGLVIIEPKLTSSNLDPRRLVSLGLTHRQTEVLSLIAKGRSNSEIATDLSLSPRTVIKHVENIYHRLGVHNRASAVAIAVSQGADSAVPRTSSDAAPLR